METHTNYINELSLRVYQKIGEQQLRGLLSEGNPLMTDNELVIHITDNFDEYLSAEEQEQLYTHNHYHVEDEGIKSLLLKIAIEIAASTVQRSFEKVLSEESFSEDNPFEIKKNPLMFMLYQFYDENFGANLRKDVA
jgi:hypothetical protein